MGRARRRNMKCSSATMKAEHVLAKADFKQTMGESEGLGNEAEGW